MISCDQVLDMRCVPGAEAPSPATGSLTKGPPRPHEEGEEEAAAEARLAGPLMRQRRQRRLSVATAGPRDAPLAL